MNLRDDQITSRSRGIMMSLAGRRDSLRELLRGSRDATPLNAVGRLAGRNRDQIELIERLLDGCDGDSRAQGWNVNIQGKAAPADQSNREHDEYETLPEFEPLIASDDPLSPLWQ